MRKPNAIFPYAEQRNAELFAAFKKLLSATPHIYIPDLLREVVSQPCSRFWVTEERATIVVSAMMRGDYAAVGLDKAEMYKEICRRVKALRESLPNKPLAYIVAKVVNSPAPRFYLSVGSAARIINGMRYARL